MYQSNFYRNIVWVFQSLFISSIPISIGYFLLGQDNHKYHYTAAAIAIAFLIYYFLNQKYASTPIEKIDNPNRTSWQWMFFLAFLTHALLDCFTMYGTQLFLPFSDYRVAFSTISVADPFGYTIPFLVCLLIAMCIHRDKAIRRRWAWAGIAISSFYLLFTIWHKEKVFKEFDRQLAEQNILYDRYTLGPYIFSNILWSITVENKDKYYHAAYSIFDTSPIKFIPIDKNHHLLKDGKDDKTIKTLRWFTDDFYNIMERPDGKLQFNDLRFGTFRQKGDIKDFIFRFLLVKEKDNAYQMVSTIGGPEEDNISNLFSDLFTRIMGK